jgi:hypothetical protein
MSDGNTRQLQMVQPTRRPAYFSLSSNAPGRHCRSSRSHSYGRPKNPIVSRNYRSLAGFLLTMNRCNRMEVRNLCRSVQTVETWLATLSLYELRVILNNALLRCEGSGRTARCVAYFATHPTPTKETVIPTRNCHPNQKLSSRAKSRDLVFDVILSNALFALRRI